jgi:hypothetical protein
VPVAAAVAEAPKEPAAPAAVKPAMARRLTAVKVTAPSRDYRDGDLVCRSCSEANDPARKFCSRCGGSLAAAIVHVVKLPWYRRFLLWCRRLWARITRRPLPDVKGGAEAAKNRPHRKHIRTVNVIRVSRSSLSLLAVLVVLMYAAVPPFRTAVNGRAAAAQGAVQRVISPTFTPVHAFSAQASSQLPTNPASAAVDGYKNTFWATDLKRDPQPFLLLTFSQRVNVDVLLFTLGVPNAFTSQPRPQQVHIDFSNGSSQDVHLSDEASPQQVNIGHGDGVTQLEIHLVSAYPSSQGSDLALTEVEMFTKN